VLFLGLGGLNSGLLGGDGVGGRSGSSGKEGSVSADGLDGDYGSGVRGLRRRGVLLGLGVLAGYVRKA
jgi:hypothetical protein